MEQQGILLHIFSGFHIGAEIILPIGKHTIGTHDSCDIILQDKCLAEHHLLIEITEHPSNNNKEIQKSYFVTIQPLEGKVSLNNQEIQEQTAWNEGELLALNTVNIAWANSDITHILHTLYTSLEQTQNYTLPQENNKQESLQKNTDKTLNANIVANSLAIIPNKKNKKKKFFLFFISLFFLLTLVLTFTPLSKNEFKNTDEIKQYLEINGFPHINILVTEKGIQFQGIIKSDQERAKLYSLAQKMQFPVYLNLIIKEDIIKTIKQTLETKQIYPTVTLSQENIFIGYYVKDPLFMQRGYTALKELIPYYAELEPKIQEKTIFAQELHEKIKEKQKKYHLENIFIEYRTGDILITGIQNKQDKEKLITLFTELEKELGFALVYRIKNKEAQKTFSSDIKKGISKKEKILNKTDFAITSVNTNAIPFITLDNNEKIFEGGLLPNGSRLEKITLKELTISTHGVISTIPLLLQ